MLMNIRRTLFIEKLQLVLTAVVSLGLVYWIIQSWFVPSDPLSPIIFLLEGSFAKLLLFGLVMWGFAVIITLTTTFSRPEGAVGIVLIALGGLSMRSHSMRSVMWSNDGSMSKIYIQMILEVLLLSIMFGVAVIIIIYLRGLIARKFPQLMWSDRMGNLSSEQIQTLRRVNAKFN